MRYGVKSIMMINYLLGKIILFVFIFICSIEDVKYKYISVNFCIGMLVLEIISYIYMFVIGENIDFVGIFCGILISLIIFLLSKLTNEAIGMGDSLFFMIISIALGYKYSMFLLFIAFFIITFVAIILFIYSLIKYKKIQKYEIALIPFFGFAYICFLIY